VKAITVAPFIEPLLHIKVWPWRL